MVGAVPLLLTELQTDVYWYDVLNNDRGFCYRIVVRNDSYWSSVNAHVSMELLGKVAFTGMSSRVPKSADNPDFIVNVENCLEAKLPDGYDSPQRGSTTVGITTPTGLVAGSQFEIVVHSAKLDSNGFANPRVSVELDGKKHVHRAENRASWKQSRFLTWGISIAIVALAITTNVYVYFIRKRRDNEVNRLRNQVGELQTKLDARELPNALEEQKKKVIAGQTRDSGVRRKNNK